MADENEAKKFETFKAENANWLADYADFMAIKEYFGNKALQDWDDKKRLNVMKQLLKSFAKNLLVLSHTIKLCNTSSLANGQS